MFSAWQQIGRAGRRYDKESHVLFYAADNPYDNYFAKDINAFINKGLDYILINTENVMILEKHMECLLSEIASLSREQRRLYKNIVGNIVYDNLKEVDLGGLTFNRGPHMKMNLRGEWSKPYKIMYNNKHIGNISSSHIQKEAYLGAIYMHAAKKYRVDSHGQSEISVKDLNINELRHITKPKLWTVVDNIEKKETVYQIANIDINYGELVIFQKYGGYEEIVNDQTINENYLELPEALQKQVMSFWITCNKLNGNDGLDALAQILHIGAPLIIPGDRYDISTMTDKNNNIYVYENIPGGIGVAKSIVKLWPNIIEQGLKITENCDCDNGCPNCLQQSRFLDPRRINKKAGIDIAHLLLNIYESNKDDIVYKIKDGKYVR